MFSSLAFLLGHDKMNVNPARGLLLPFHKGNLEAGDSGEWKSFMKNWEGTGEMEDRTNFRLNTRCIFLNLMWKQSKPREHK